MALMHALKDHIEGVVQLIKDEPPEPEKRQKDEPSHILQRADPMELFSQALALCGHYFFEETLLELLSYDILSDVKAHSIQEEKRQGKE
jgi:hypothetical protein